jgi:hypothetical protein
MTIKSTLLNTLGLIALFPLGVQSATIATEPESSSLAYEQILSRNEANDSVTVHILKDVDHLFSSNLITHSH